MHNDEVAAATVVQRCSNQNRFDVRDLQPECAVRQWVQAQYRPRTVEQNLWRLQQLHLIFGM